MLWLVGVAGPADGISLPLRNSSTLVGRSRTCELVLTSPAVSRRHCLLVASPDSVWVEDLHSTNGTFINERRVRRARLREGETLRIGDCVFRLEIAAAPDDSGPPVVPTGDTEADPTWIPEDELSAVEGLFDEAVETPRPSPRRTDFGDPPQIEGPESYPDPSLANGRPLPVVEADLVDLDESEAASPPEPNPHLDELKAWLEDIAEPQPSTPRRR